MTDPFVSLAEFDDIVARALGRTVDPRCCVCHQGIGMWALWNERLLCQRCLRLAVKRRGVA